MYEKASSKESEIYLGVFQGAIPIPVLFYLYINALTENLVNCTSALYADDSSQPITHKTDIILEQLCHENLKRMLGAFSSNSL